MFTEIVAFTELNSLEWGPSINTKLTCVSDIPKPSLKLKHTTCNNLVYERLEKQPSR